MSPIYVYRCATCGRTKEVRRSFEEDEALGPPACRHDVGPRPAGGRPAYLEHAMEKVIQPVGFRTPGGNGFYDTGRV